LLYLQQAPAAAHGGADPGVPAQEDVILAYPPVQPVHADPLGAFFFTIRL